MIASLTGTIESCDENGVVLNVNGIGFDVRMSAEGIRALTARGGETVHVHTYTSFGREGDVTLFGFLSADELGLFRKLITVSGIGPKGGLSLLSAMSADELIFAILAGDAKTISRAPGIGKKTAERLVLDLHDKLALSGDADIGEAGGAPAAGSFATAADAGAAGEAVEALTALGYSGQEATKAVRTASAEDGMETADTQTLLSRALRYL